jgi:hypothetical protein
LHFARLDVQKGRDRVVGQLRNLALPDKFDVHEWAIMDRFSESQKVARLQNDLHAAIRGAAPSACPKRSNFDRSLCDGVKSTALSFGKRNIKGLCRNFISYSMTMKKFTLMVSALLAWQRRRRARSSFLE